MVWACCWRSVDTRTYNAARIGGSFLLCCRRRRPTQHQLVRPIPPRLPVRLFAGLPPDLEGAPHGCPSPLPKPQSEGYTRRAPASAAAAATSPDEAGHDGSSRTCHLRSNHRTHLPVLQADPWPDPAPPAQPRASRPVGLADRRRLHPAPPRPAAARGLAPPLGAALDARSAHPVPRPAWLSSHPPRAGHAGQCAETLPARSRPPQGSHLRPGTPPPGRQKATQSRHASRRQNHWQGLKPKFRGGAGYSWLAAALANSSSMAVQPPPPMSASQIAWPSTSRSRSRCSSTTVVCSGPSGVNRTSISLACWGSGSYCHWPLICQVTTSRFGGSQASTRPQSHWLPSVPCSYQRPPSRGSRIAWAMSAWPMWYWGGHQVWIESVKTRNARSTGTLTVTVPWSGGMVGVVIVPPDRGRTGPPRRPSERP